MRKIVVSAIIALAAILSLSHQATGQRLLSSKPAKAAAQADNGRILSPREAMWADHENEELWTMTQVLKLTPDQHAAIRKIWETDDLLPPQPQSARCADPQCLADWPLIGQSKRIDSLMTPQQQKEFALYVRVDNVVGERMDALTRYLRLTLQQRWKLRPLLVKSREEMYLWRGPDLDDAARFHDDLYFPEPSMDCSATLSPNCVGNMLLIAEHDMERSVLTPPQRQVLDAAIVATREKKREELNTVFFIPAP